MRSIKKPAAFGVVLNAALYVALPVILLAVWKGADLAGMLKPYTMPAPEKVAQTAVAFCFDGTLFKNIAASVIRVAEGFLIALVLALLLGTAIGLSKKMETFTELVIQIIKPIPPIAWIPLAILWFGIEEKSKIFIIAIGAFFPVLLNTVEGIKNIDSKYFELAKVYEVKRRKVVTHVILLGALPFIVTGIRIGLANAWICVVAAEMIAATSGIGYMLMDGRSLARPDIVILGMLVIGIFGKLMDDFLRVFFGRIIKWH